MLRKLELYLELSKPRLSALAVFSGLTGYVMARDPNLSFTMKNWMELLWLFVGLCFVGVASNMVNQAIEGKLDSEMDRTKDRPIPSGRITAKETTIVAFISLAIGLGILDYFFRREVMWLNLFTFISYVAIYTPMKTRSAMNTIAGAFPGAFPILSGWIAGSNNDFHLYPNNTEWFGFFPFALVFIWQLPHFFSIAWIYKEDYERAGYKMMSLYDKSGRQAVVLIFVGTIGTIFVSYLPFFYDMCDLWYFFSACALNCYLLISSILLMKDRQKYMKQYFYASIIWLPAILTAMLIFLTLELK